MKENIDEERDIEPKLSSNKDINLKLNKLHLDILQNDVISKELKKNIEEQRNFRIGAINKQFGSKTPDRYKKLLEDSLKKEKKEVIDMIYNDVYPLIIGSSLKKIDYNKYIDKAIVMMNNAFLSMGYLERKTMKGLSKINNTGFNVYIIILEMLENIMKYSYKDSMRNLKKEPIDFEKLVKPINYDTVTSKYTNRQKTI